ncbi:MAG TPA: hypothetical protein PKA13_08305 [Geminicoccaceae bacterium]|nr:hypothetical protein [Geminicoccus sp.]HMU49764.1 hypothetical protein [Geminicoccaceae bacterium]
MPIAWAACLVLFLPLGARAHAFPERYDLPLPLGLYVAGAGAAVALSFLVAAALPPGPRPQRQLTFRLPRIAGTLVAVVRVVAVLLLALLLVAGFLGSREHWDRNILPVVVWVWWWVGMTFVCALIGDVWAVVDPWATVGRRLVGERPPPLRLPEWLGVWPAVAGFLAFAWIELVWPSNAMPGRLATAILAYSLLTWTAMALFSVESWRERGDVFALVFGLFGRFAPISARDGRLVLRPYGAGLRQPEPATASLTALVLTVLATVSFDGIAETMAWLRVEGAAISWLYDRGVVHILGYVGAETLVRTAGLLAAPLALAAAYLAAAAIAARIDGRPVAETAGRYALSLVPIAIGYHLAHYFSYLLIQGQDLWALLSDPLGRGWNLFGTRGHEVDIGGVDMRLVWLTAVGGIVAGHALAVQVAHRCAIGLRGQLPIIVLMIAYTMLSLWIMAQPIARG